MAELKDYRKGVGWSFEGGAGKGSMVGWGYFHKGRGWRGIGRTVHTYLPNYKLFLMSTRNVLFDFSLQLDTVFVAIDGGDIVSVMSLDFLCKIEK